MDFDAGWLEAETRSAHAGYFAPLLRWPALYGGADGWFDLHHWPRLLAFARRFKGRPAAIRAALSEGLGPCRFPPPHPAARLKGARSDREPSLSLWRARGRACLTAKGTLTGHIHVYSAFGR